MKKFLYLAVISNLSAAIIVSHADLNQTGSFSDTILTTSNVNTSTFSKKGSYQVDVPIFAQPIVIPAVLVSGNIKDLLIISTMTNKVYAFDANVFGPALWRVNIGPTRQFFITRGISDLTTFTDLGIMGTPAADTSINALFVVGALPSVFRLYKLSLSSGDILAQIDISGQVVGTGFSGDIVISGKLQFNAPLHFQRAGLTIANNNVYIAFGSVADNTPWHGWLFAYDETTLSQIGLFCSTPSSYGGGIWQSGGSPSVDSFGNIYITTGNNNSVADGIEFGEAIIKLSPTLSIIDYFIPSSFAALDSVDADISSSRVILIPGTQKLAVSGKDFNVYLVDTTCMGHLQGTNLNCTLQTFKTNVSGVIGAASGAYGLLFDNNTLYTPTTDGKLFSFNYTGTSFNSTPILSQNNTYGFPGASQLSASNGIIWAVTSDLASDKKPNSAILRAIRESDFTELWNSSLNNGDVLGHIAKYVSPLIYNGRVYVPNQDGQVQVYGLN